MTYKKLLYTVIFIQQTHIYKLLLIFIHSENASLLGYDAVPAWDVGIYTPVYRHHIHEDWGPHLLQIGNEQTNFYSIKFFKTILLPLYQVMNKW